MLILCRLPNTPGKAAIIPPFMGDLQHPFILPRRRHSGLGAAGGRGRIFYSRGACLAERACCTGRQTFVKLAPGSPIGPVRRCAGGRPVSLERGRGVARTANHWPDQGDPLQLALIPNGAPPSLSREPEIS